MLTGKKMYRVKIKLSEQLGKRRMSQKNLAKLTGSTTPVINSLYHEKVIRINLFTLAKIGEVLQCKLSDLLEFVEVENPNTPIKKADKN